MNTIPLVRAGILKQFINFLDRVGAPTEQVLQRHHLLPIVMADSERLIPMLSGVAFIEAAARSEDIEHFGTLIGQQTQNVHLGAFGQLISNSSPFMICS